LNSLTLVMIIWL